MRSPPGLLDEPARCRLYLHFSRLPGPFHDLSCSLLRRRDMEKTHSASLLSIAVRCFGDGKINLILRMLTLGRPGEAFALYVRFGMCHLSSASMDTISPCFRDSMDRICTRSFFKQQT